MKTIDLSVYRHYPKGEGCTNGGVTEVLDRIRLIVEGDYEGDPALAPPDLFREENRSALHGGVRPGESVYWAAVPVLTHRELHGPMDGGSLAVHECGIAGVRNERVYHVHDRFETWKLYDRLSV